MTNEYALPSPLTFEDCREFPEVVFGHIHQPGVLAGGRVRYGAPSSTTILATTVRGTPT